MSAPALHPAEAFELLRFLNPLHARLLAAQELLGKKRDSERERRWLADATALVAEEAARHVLTLERARALSELNFVVEDLAEEDQGRWVDLLEKLVAGITFHAGSRSPLIEALFPHQKWPALRRASRDEVKKYAAELQRRAKTSYVARMTQAPELTFVPPLLDEIAAAYARWEACFAPQPTPENEAEELRGLLRAGAKDADRVIRQAKLLAEAALTRWEGMFEEAGLHAKPKKRTPKPEAKADVAAEAPEAPKAETAAPEQPAPAAEPAKPAKAPKKRAATKAGEA